LEIKFVSGFSLHERKGTNNDRNVLLGAMLKGARMPKLPPALAAYSARGNVPGGGPSSRVFWAS
jgi:hypothetical protein